ncbi:hypothetical protein CLOSTMETH_00689 [[Clostridium] methylpentosum DSM 5476]|uniref:Uncharacterized protein n=1 Tax=[Clostridium] methylpentosum DSM 5476 TaxID=537013 RepID=C0EA35_9FIRM|nr:hypothetical protein CLOSTMETH_00689 [[Clostridium] methylpentosum DSM 5476]
MCPCFHCAKRPFKHKAATVIDGLLHDSPHCIIICICFKKANVTHTKDE